MCGDLCFVMIFTEYMWLLFYFIL